MFKRKNVYVVLLLLNLLTNGSANANCLRGIHWVRAKIEDKDAKRPDPKMLDADKKEAWLDAQPDEIEAKMRILADNIRRVTQGELETKLKAALVRLTQLLQYDQNVYFYLPGSTAYSGRSNQWVFQLITDELIKSNPKFLYKIQSVTKAQFDAMPTKPRTVVYADDASYTGEQATGRLRILQNAGVREFITLFPFYTSSAKRELESGLGVTNVIIMGPETGPNMETVGELAARTPALTDAFMSSVFRSDWQNTALTYFDHRVADDVSILTVHGALGGRLLEGPVMEKKPNNTYFQNGQIELIDNINDTPY